jgi:hypothetical protein
MSAGQRERGEAGAKWAALGRKLVGPAGKRKKGEVGRGGWLFYFFSFLLFFSNPFQTNFKPFKFKSFSCFQTQILTQIYSTILRLLENLLNHFSNIKFKLSTFFLIQTFTPISQLFLRTFHNYFFKDF